MKDWSSLQYSRVVRLNAKLFPPSDMKPACAPLPAPPNRWPRPTRPADLIRWTARLRCVVCHLGGAAGIRGRTAGRCRVISRLGTGTDKIAVDLATRRGILVTNVPYFCVEEQADHTLALLLSLARQIPGHVRATCWPASLARPAALSRLNQRPRRPDPGPGRLWQ